MQYEQDIDSGEAMPDAVVTHAGFPNPAADTSLGGLDLHRLLVPRPASTFLFQVAGTDWHDLGIFDGDIAVIDRAIDPLRRDIVAWWHAPRSTFALSMYRDMPSGAAVWGVVTSTVRRLRKAER